MGQAILYKQVFQACAIPSYATLAQNILL